MRKNGQTFSIYAVAAILAVGLAIYAQDSKQKVERQISPAQEREYKEREHKEREQKEREVKEFIFTRGDVGVAFAEGFEHQFAEKLVKGAPFSAQIVIEKTQTLANGVHISSKSTGAIYRDSEGRTRTEEPRDGAPEIVLINDPVAGVAYHLHMFNQTAVKVKYDSLEANREAAKVYFEIEHRRAEMEKKAMAEPNRERRNKELIAEAQLKEDHDAGRDRRVESLGNQSFDGVQAAGTRVTLTFAAGTEGNDQPFDIVSEKWYSAELQMVVMTRHNDPRSGENVYRLTNINRSEPSRSLFEAPTDFQLKEEKAKVEVKRKY